MKALKVFGIIAGVFWAVFVAWQAYLAHDAARQACTNTYKIEREMGRAKGSYTDVIIVCR